MNGTETTIVRDFVEQWHATELKKPRYSGSFYLLLFLSIKRLTEHYDRRWSHMSAAKLDELGLRAKYLRGYVSRKMKNLDIKSDDKDGALSASEWDDTNMDLETTPGYDSGTK